MAINNSKLKYWSKLSQKWESSGLVQLKFCEQENININTFGKWRTRVKPNSTTKKVSNRVDKDIQTKQLKFLPVKISEDEEKNELNDCQVAVMVEFNHLKFQIYNSAKFQALKNLFLALGVNNDKRNI